MSHQKPTIRLLSYNIHKGIGGRDRRYRLRRVLDVIEHESPDLICLQEVDRSVRRSRYDNQPRLIAEHFQFQWVFQKNVFLKTGGYGNLILSRWPIVEKHQISLRLNNKKPRGAQLVVIQSPLGKVHLVNWHLGLSEKERLWQTNHLLAHHLFRQSCHLPTMIIGDSNDWRNRLHKHSFAAAGFDHSTHPISRFRTFPAWMSMGSLDKAFHCQKIDVTHAKVTRTKLTKAASDHLPLVIDFSIINH